MHIQLNSFLAYPINSVSGIIFASLSTSLSNYSKNIMLFNRASRSLLNGAFRRFKSTSAGAGEPAGESAFAVAAVGTTFATYMLADFLSNFIQHPTQKVRTL